MDENQEIKEESKELMQKEENYVVTDLSNLGSHTDTKVEVITNLTDQKTIFNLENKVDRLLNDCVDEAIRVKHVLIKRYEKPLKEPIMDEETGEIIKENEISMSCVLVDDSGVSYATGSKVFTIQLLRFLQMHAKLGGNDETFDIKIIKKKMAKSGNMALSFELI